ncbi:InlB B-repeat-containing protein [Enterococcus hulanensis]|uniref:InlB B-repeat-containing protein n=1 Tax=Enterococcus hulanensis TaxID=2559929 RepID=UPI001A8CF7E2|nr:InlB B-repeat-containing protein [Enterococcus hulanensis]MBO0457187.1 InlB B-repeat-containing protein [Enterococcus hulanensis]
MKRKSLISLVCVAVLSQYGLAPVTALATENDKTATGTASSEDLKTNTILDELPLSSENTEEATVESEDAAVESSEATESTTEELTEVEEAKTLNWEFKDSQQALIAGDDFAVKIKGTQTTAKLELPEGIEYDAEKNVEEIRPLISFDKETRELTMTKIDEYDEIELVLTVEKAGEYELQLKNEAQGDMGNKLKFAVAEKAEELKEEEQKDTDKKEEQKKDNKTKTKIGPQAAQHSNVSLNVNSTPDDKITDSSKIINYIVDFSHSLSTDVLTDGKIVITLTNGVFVKVPTKSSNMKSLSMSYDKKTITIELNDDWNSGNVDSVSLSVKSAVGISKGDNISLNAEFTGKFKKETDSFSNVAKKEILFDAEGIKDVQPGTSDWAITGWKDAQAYAGTDTEIIGYLKKENESTKEGFSNLKIKIHVSDPSKLNWFSKLFKQMAYHDTENALHAINLEDNQIQKIDDQTYIFTLGNISPEEVTDLLTFMNVNLPEDAQPGESVSVKAEYYNDDTQIFDVPVMTITVKEAETNFTFRYRRDTQGKELAPGQTFNTAVTIMGTTGKPIDDVVVETEVPDEVQPNKVVNGIMSNQPALKKVEYFDGADWFEATSQGDEFLFPENKTIKKVRYHYVEVPYRPGAHQPFRTFYTVKSTSEAGDTFELPNSVTFTDAKGIAQTIESTPNTLDYVVVADKKEQENKIATYKYLPKGDFGIVSSGEKYTRSYRMAAITGEIDKPYIFVKVPKGIAVENKYNSIQYPYDNSYKTVYPLLGTPASPSPKANNVGSFQTEDGDTVYYFKADDTKLSAADYVQMLLVENQYTIGYMMSGNYEVEVGMGSLTEDFTEPELNDFTAETLSTEMQTKLGASISNYYSNKQVLTVGQGERVNTTVNVKGSEDSDWKDATKNEVGTVTPGKKVSYKISMKNDGAERYSDVELVNILPHIGDALVSSPSSPRGSEFQINPDSGGIKVYLNGVETNDVTLQYSLSNDPVRFASPSGDPIGSGAWVSSVSDFSQVRAVRVSLPNARLNPGDELVLEYSGVVVLDAKRPANDTETFVAKNSVAYKFETEAGTLRVNEPAVSSVQTSIAQNDGLISGNVYIDLNKDGNKAGSEPGLNQVQFELFKKEGSNFVPTGLTSESSSDSSNKSGIFGFNDLEYGTYKVKVTLPSSKGAEFITAGTDGVETIDTKIAWVTKNSSTEFTINDLSSTSHEIKDLRVPLFVNTPLNGTINFVNKDGNVVASDYGKDFTVELYKGTTKAAGTTAGDHGAYVFENLSINSSDEYKVKVTAPSGKNFVFTEANPAGEITIDMEPGIGTKDATDLYITDTDTPTASIAVDNGHGSSKDINPDSVTLTAADKTTSISTDWKITKGGTVEYSGTSAKGTISLEDQISYLIGDKKAGDYTVEMTVTDFAGNQTTVTKNFSIKFATASYMVETTEYAKEENLLLYSGKLTKPKTDPTKAGYVFDKWVKESDNTEWDFSTGTISEENLVLKATFKAAKQKVTFDINGGDASTQPDEIEKDTATTVDLSGVAAPTRKGYTFNHWYRQGDAGKTNVGASVVMPVGGMTLVADWSANSYEVSFDKNDGTGSMADQSFKYDAAQNLTANTFTREGYSFQGWATSKDGAKKYDDKESVKNLTATKDGTVTLFAVWAATEQTITFDVNGGLESSKPAPIKGDTDSTIDLKDVKKPTRTGYTFNHWYKQGDAGKADVGNSVKMPAKGMTLVAEWTANSYTVTFDKNEGTGTMAAQNFKYDTAQNLTANKFTREGYSFQGWSTTKTGSVEHTDGKSVKNLTADVDGSVMLFAIWKADSQVIQFDVNGGDITSKPANISGDTDSTVDLKDVKDPTRTGYTFKHWYKSDDAGKADVGNSVKMPAKGMTLVAEWTANSYTVTFDKNDGTGTMADQSFKYDTAQNLTTNKFTREGYSFQGWSTTKTGAAAHSDGASVKNLTADKDGSVTLYAIWKADSQVIQFDVNGGDITSKPANISGDTDSTVDLKDVKAPTRTGYTFKHWYKQGDAGKTDVGNSVKMPAKGMTLVAEWTANSYTVTFDKNDGTGTMADQSFKYDTAQNLSANKFTREGYSFQGWSTTKTGAVVYVDSASAKNLTADKDGSVTLYAIWKADSQVIQFDVNGGDIASKPGNISGDTDSTVDLKDVKAPTRKGYIFKHWYKSDDAGKADVGNSVKMPAKGMTLVAEWEANSYTVNFHNNTGTGTMTAQSFKYDEAKKLTKNTFTKEGYNFVGWSTTANGASAYTDEALVTNLTDMKDGSFDLYALWSADAQVIQFDVNGGDVSSKPANINGNTDDTIDLKDVKAPTRTGYTFKHWYKSDDAGKADVGNSVKMPAKGMTLVAQWEANSYTVTFDKNEGAGTMAEQNFKYDTAKNLNANKFTRAGYSFQGWSTKNTGTVMYAEGASVSNLTDEKDGTVTLYAIWKADSQAIQFDVNGGDVASKPANIDADTDSTVDLKDVKAPTRTGYTFKHWYKQGDADKKNVGTSVKMPANGMTLVAEWEANSYSVKFHNNTGTGTMTDQSFKYDESKKLTKNSFTKAGYTFDGWATAANAASAYTDGQSVSNLTDKKDDTFDLYAIWSADAQVIQFDVNGGDVSSKPANINGNTDDTIDLKDVKAPTRTGYTFKHWYKSDDAGKADVGNSVKMPTKGMTLVAEWEANTYKVKFNANGGTETMNDQNFVYDKGQALTENKFKRAGYTFAGWATTATGTASYADKATVSNLTATDKEVVELFAVWTADNQTIQFDVNGGADSSKPADIVAGTDSNVDLSKVKAPTRKGYTFNHWYKKDDAAKTAVTGTITMPVGGMILVADWEANDYKVKFDANEGTGTMADQDFVYDTEQKLTANAFDRTNYDFVGWSTTKTGKVEFADREAVKNLTDEEDGSKTLYAIWKIQERVISFDVNGGDGATQPADIQKEIGEKVNLDDVTAPTREGYSFAHWYKKDDAAKTAVTGTITMPDANMVLVAAWNANHYKVTFDANGGTGTMKDQAFVYDTAQELTGNTFERKNYDFIGWATEKEGVVTYYDKESVNNLTTKDSDTITLYAIWEKKAVLPALKVNNIVLTTDQVDEFMKDDILDKKIAELSDAKIIDENTQEVIAGHEKVTVDISNVKNKKGTYKASISYDTKARATAISKEIDVTVIEPSKKTQKISFDVNGGDEKSKPADISAQVGTTVSLKDVKEPTKSGYSFAGWFNGETKAGDTVEMPDNGMILVAYWSQDGGGNGGNGSNGSETNGGSNGSGTTNTNILARTGTTSTGKSLPQTNDTPTIGLSIVGGMLALLALFGFKKKKDEESENESK